MKAQPHPAETAEGRYMRHWARLSRAILCTVALLAVAMPSALADLPYPALPPGLDPYDYGAYLFLREGDPLPNDFGTWKLTSERTDDPVRYRRQELFGVMGASVDKAWLVTTGRPDVLIAVLDSGVQWQDNQPDLFNKIYLNAAELPLPLPPPQYNCPFPHDDHDWNCDGFFNVQDYGSDPRVYDANGNGARDPEDLILIFSDGLDDDGNGYVDDISGWDFFEGDNNPRDDVRYGHGTGEMQDSSAEGNNGGDIGSALNGMVMAVRVGDSFVADANEFAQGVVFAVESGASIVQEALGTVNSTRFAMEAVDYAYHHGTTVIGSAGDEQGERLNYPAAYPHAIMDNSVTKYAELGPIRQSPHSYLYLNGCTNYGGRIDVAVSSSSCSSEATGRLSGMAGLVYAAALNKIDRGEMSPYPGTDWPLSANEVRQIITMSADDVNFQTPHENYGTWVLLPSERFHSRSGWDPYFGYGRANARKMVEMVDSGRIPPEADIESPAWYTVVDPDAGVLSVTGRVAAVRLPPGGTFHYKVEVATSANPGSDYLPVYESGPLSGAYEGTLAEVDLGWLAAQMPNGVEGPLSGPDGRGDPDRFSFILRVQAIDDQDPGSIGEARRSLFLHRDPELMAGFPQQFPGDGVGSPAFVDLDGDGTTELLFATSNGLIHALQPSGAELPGWPVSGDPIPLPLGSPGYASGEISLPVFAAFGTGSPAVGDLEGDGSLEVVAADMEGKVYAWEADGTRRPAFPVSTNRGFSTVFRPNGEYRRNRDNRVDWAVWAQPSLGDLDGDGLLEIVSGSADMHVYAWQADGTPLPGWPVYLRSPEKVEYVEPGTHFTVLRADANAEIGSKIIATPSLGDINGDGRLEVVVGTNEEYAEPPNMVVPPLAAELLSQAASLGCRQTSDADTDADLPDTGEQAGTPSPQAASMGNGRLYAIWADGTLHDGDPGDDDGLDPDALLPGWPVRLGQLILEVLPTVGTGMNMPAVLADVNGDGAFEVGAASIIGSYYVLGGDGVSIYGRIPVGDRQVDVTLPGTGDAFGPMANSSDAPLWAAVGGGIFADLGDGLSVAAPSAGLGRALDLQLPADQLTSDAQVSAWNVAERAFQDGFPHHVNDMQFLTAPSAADVDGDALAEVLTGSGAYDLHAVDRYGDESGNWPRLAGEAVVSTPAAGDFDGDGLLDVAVLTRHGWLFVWRTAGQAGGPQPWPKYQHDLLNSGRYQAAH